MQEGVAGPSTRGLAAASSRATNMQPSPALPPTQLRQELGSGGLDGASNGSPPSSAKDPAGAKGGDLSRQEDSAANLNAPDDPRLSRMVMSNSNTNFPSATGTQLMGGSTQFLGVPGSVPQPTDRYVCFNTSV